LEKWDKKDAEKDELISVIKNAIPKFLDNQSKERIQTFHFAANLTKEQLKKVSEALN